MNTFLSFTDYAVSVGILFGIFVSIMSSCIPMPSYLFEEFVQFIDTTVYLKVTNCFVMIRGLRLVAAVKSNQS